MQNMMSTFDCHDLLMDTIDNKVTDKRLQL
jgi:hypothetical protein